MFSGKRPDNLGVKDGRLALDFNDAITRDTCVTHAGEVRHS